MIFTAKERLSFKQLYPQSGNLLTNSVIKSIDDKVTLSSEELSLLDLAENGSFPLKNLEKVGDKPIEFTDIEIQELKSWVSKKDNAKDISYDIFGMCEKINGLKKSS